MKKEMKNRVLTYSLLNGEYLSWALRYGDDRNENDLRFGQYLHSKYDMSEFKIDVFYFEDYEEVYSELLKDLYERVEK